MLDGLQDAQWKRGTKSRGAYYTLEGLFRLVPEHFREHEEEINNRPTGA
ncbi:MAG: hypothetical protein WEC75_05220 [Dehalococcoidia bacterium]